MKKTHIEYLFFRISPFAKLYRRCLSLLAQAKSVLFLSDPNIPKPKSSCFYQCTVIKKHHTEINNTLSVASYLKTQETKQLLDHHNLADSSFSHAFCSPYFFQYDLEDVPTGSYPRASQLSSKDFHLERGPFVHGHSSRRPARYSAALSPKKLFFLPGDLRYLGLGI